jgi:hypothetical protein
MDEVIVATSVEMREQTSPASQIRECRYAKMVDEHGDHILAIAKQMPDVVRVVHLPRRPRSRRTSTDEPAIQPDHIA